jgi:hypothetical protein
MGYWNPKSRLRPTGFLLYAYLPEHYKNPIESMRKSWGKIWGSCSNIFKQFGFKESLQKLTYPFQNRVWNWHKK